jgi:peptidoglycan/xylan/chitin deacetylase (PgdA/CDA1 family)
MTFKSSWSKLQGYYQREAVHWLFKRPVSINLKSPLISFTFDDFPRSALLTGGSILNQLGIRGTYYVSLGLLGRYTPTGEMFIGEDLELALKQKHELGCHTFAHCHSWQTRIDQFQSSIMENGIVLNKLIPGAQFRTFSYPISPPRPRTKARTAHHFLCCRGGGQTLNVGIADLNYLAAYFLEKSQGIQDVKDLVDRNRDVRGWLIFATHDVAKRHTPYGCTPEFFGDVAEYAARSGAQILPVVEALECCVNGNSS